MLLNIVRRLLAADGAAIVTTPNTGSLHRRLGEYLGIETSRRSLNSRSTATATQQLYEMSSLRKTIEGSGWRIHDLRGMFLKPFSNQQMAGYTDEILDALMAVSDELPGELAKTLVAVISPRFDGGPPRDAHTTESHR